MARPLLRAIIEQIGDDDKGAPHAQVTIWELARNVAQFVAFKFASRQMGITDNPLIRSTITQAGRTEVLIFSGKEEAMLVMFLLAALGSSIPQDGYQ